MAPTPRTLFADAGNVTYDCTNCFGPCAEDPNCFPSRPPPPPLLTPITTQFSVNPKSHLVTNLLIATAAVLASCFLLLIATYAIHRLRRRRRLLSVSPADPPPNAAEGGTQEDHHIWNIRTVGLEESVIHSIATSVYSAKSGGTADCSVCLGEFHDGEILRLLPKCGHAFHLPCIDRWLRSHLNCPLCRAPVLAPDNPPAAGELGSALPAQTETTQVGGLELEVVIHPTVAASSSSHSQPTDLPTDELQPVRRSVSMDSASLAVLMLRASPGDEMNEVVKNKGRLVNGVKEQKGEKGMVRSSSTRSGRFFLSRHRRWNSVLPV